MSQLSSRMKVDKKSIQVMVCKTMKYSMVTLCKFAKEYPYASGVFFIFILLYLYVPFLFYVLLFSSPILICTLIFIRFHRTSLRNKHDQKKEMEVMMKTTNEEPQAKAKLKDLVNKSKKGLRAQKSVRRNRRNENIELDTQVNKLERTCDRLISPSALIEAFITGADDLLEEKHKLLGEEERVSDHGQSCDQDLNLDPDPASCEESAGEPVELPDIVEDQNEAVDSTDDEEEPCKSKHNNKAVAWTKDDERNLMDLGFSELERNKRLESLMARRRASKLFRLAVEKTLMGQENIHPTLAMASLSTARISPFHGSSYVNGAVPHMPGSAPSVLLPGHNPFDLPYEPQEERPILTGDCFDKEFFVANHKDILFCRHESFLCRTCHRQESPGANLAATSFLDKRFLKELEHARDKKISDNATQPEKTSLVAESPKEVTKSEEEVKMEKEKDSENESLASEIQLESLDNGQEELEAQKSNEDIERAETESMQDNGSCSSSSSDYDDMMLKERKKFPQLLTDHVQKVLSLSTPPKSAAMKRSVQDWSLFAIETNRAEDNMFFKNKGAWHNHNQSIASDLQVEFSEIGSPPLTVDETASPTDEVAEIYDEDIERAIAHQQVRTQDGSRPGLDTGDHLHSGTQNDISNVPHGLGIEQRSTSLGSSISPTSVLLNDALSGRMSVNIFEEPTQDEIEKEDSVGVGSSGGNEKYEHEAANLHVTSLPSAASKATDNDQLHPSAINNANQASNKEESHVNVSPEVHPDNKKDISNHPLKSDVIYDVEDKAEEVHEAVRTPDGSRPGLDTGDHLHSGTQNGISNVPHGLGIEHRSMSLGSSISPTSVLLNDAMSGRMSVNIFEEPTQIDVMDLPSYEQQDALQLINNSGSQSNSGPANLTKEEYVHKTKGELGEKLSNVAKESSRSNAKESSSEQVVHEDNTVNNTIDQNVNEKQEQVSETENAFEVEDDTSANETKEERPTKLKERSGAGEIEKSGQGDESSQVEEAVEQSNSDQELGKPVNKENGTNQLKQKEERSSSNENQAREILNKVKDLQEDGIVTAKSRNDVNSAEQSK